MSDDNEVVTSSTEIYDAWRDDQLADDDTDRLSKNSTPIIDNQT